MFYRISLIAFAVYGLIWTQLEGSLRNVTILGIAAAVLLAWTIWRRWIFGRITLTRARYAIYLALTGTMTGLLAPILVLTGMAIKQSLHGHGPEYNSAEVDWLVNQFLLWASAGTLFGIALGLLTPVPQPTSKPSTADFNTS
jgi:hypothetical protein